MPTGEDAGNQGEIVRLHKTCATLVAATLLAACAAPKHADPDELRLTVNSEPAGAEIFYMSGDRYVLAGPSPQTLVFPITSSNRAAGRVSLLGVAARWPSGASQSLRSIEANLANGMHHEYTVMRPAQAAGLEIDQQAARAVAAPARATPAQARTEDARGAALLYLGISGLDGYNRGRDDALRRDDPVFRPSTPTLPAYTCNSKRAGMFGDQVRTDCRPQ